VLPPAVTVAVGNALTVKIMVTLFVQPFEFVTV